MYFIKMDQGPYYQTPNSKVDIGKSRKYLGNNGHRQGLPQWNPSSSATKRKHREMGTYKTKKLLLNKRNGLLTEETTQ
jgi:hypothetical protein